MGIITIILLLFLVLLFFWNINLNDKINILSKKQEVFEEKFRRLLFVLQSHDDEENIQSAKKNKSSSKNKIIAEVFHDPLKGDVLKPELRTADPESPLFGKKVVFTGLLSGYERVGAASITKFMGADINGSISKRTNYVVVGSDPGPRKMQMIEELNEAGANIKLLNEIEFHAMVEPYYEQYKTYSMKNNYI